MIKLRIMVNGAIALTRLLSRTVATVTIAKHACTGPHAGETLGAIGTVVTVCGSSVLGGCQAVAHGRVLCRGLRAHGDQTFEPAAYRGMWPHGASCQTGTARNGSLRGAASFRYSATLAEWFLPGAIPQAMAAGTDTVSSTVCFRGPNFTGVV